MDLNITEIDNLDDDDVEDVGFIDGNGKFTPAPAPTSRVPIPRITTMAHKNRGSLAPPVPEPQPARKVTYDDILSSLNMKVVDGKLQIVRNVVAENVRSNNFIPQQQQQQQQQQRQQTKFVPMQPQQQFQQNQSNQSKRFQSMHQPLQQQEMQPAPILTKEQYRQVQIANYMKEVQRIQHIRNAKSTKLKFSNMNTSINVSPVMGNTNDLNKLFPLKGVGNR
jgi:hypothetical protein